MDDAQLVWSVTAAAKRLDYIADVAESIAYRVQRESEVGSAEVNALAADVAWISRQLALLVRSMSREGSKPPEGILDPSESAGDGRRAEMVARPVHRECR